MELRKNEEDLQEARNLALHAQSRGGKWYVDSECSKHMTGNRYNFLKLKEDKGGNFYFGDNESTKILGNGIISLGNKKTKAENVLFVENMKDTCKLKKREDEIEALYGDTKCNLELDDN